MPRDLPIGNGSLLITFDAQYCLRDLYFPNVGHENNTLGHPCRVGVWIDGAFRWLHDREGWERSLQYEPDTLVTDVTLEHRDIGVTLHFQDAVHPTLPVLIRSIQVTNCQAREREVRLFFCHDLYIAERPDGDTAYYEPVNDVLMHYKGPRYFLANGRSPDGQGIFEYATGIKACFGCEGTWRDAEDGQLGKNAIAQGSVDSVMSLRHMTPALGRVQFYYWLAAARDFFEVKELNQTVLEKGPATLIQETREHWRKWVAGVQVDDCGLAKPIQDLCRRSLLIIRTQVDNGGAILAANDSDSSEFNRDTYSYMWPRDGALVASALDRTGFYDLTAKFFHFCARLMPKPSYYPEGYLLHKYNPDGSLGSSWHPWVRNGRPTLPIQEDGTALVLWALWQHYLGNRDRELVSQLYPRMIKPAAQFMLLYRHLPTGLPLESYDLWEERYGILTFTATAVCAALDACANFAELFGDQELKEQCRAAHQGMKAGLLRHLYRPDLGRFARMLTLRANHDDYDVDATIDSSLYALFALGVFPADQVEVSNTMRAIENRLSVRTAIGGVARYENDYYRRVSEDFHNVPGNPWFICTLWLAQWYVAIAKTPQDLARPREILQWVAEHALPSGVLAEQLDPYSGAPRMVSPLTWSHATYVDVILKYQSKYRELFPAQETPGGGDATAAPKTLRRMAAKESVREEYLGLVRPGAP
jgi:glucoamylase